MEAQISNLETSLALTDEQVVAVRGVFQQQTAAYEDQLKELEQSENYGPDTVQALWHETREKTKLAMKARLTPAQYDEYLQSLDAESFDSDD